MIHADAPAPSRMRYASLALLLAALLLAYVNRFTQDDAFISFVYVENLAEGRGLVWSTGERVEGYTNFLFVLLLAGFRLLGAAPEQAAPVLGLLSFAAALLLSARLAARLSGKPAAGLLAIVLLGSNFTASSYATGGLEASLTIALILAGVALAEALLRRPADIRPGPAAGFGLLAALALLSRLDSVLFLAPFGGLLLWAMVRGGPRPRWTPALAMLVSGAVPLAVWFAWKVPYYGDLLPNTFYAKQGNGRLVLFGLLYFYMFCLSYLFTPLIWAYAAVRQVRDGGNRPLVAALLVAAALWVLHCLKAGGDTLEFRFVVPLIAVGSILTAAVCATLPRRAAAALVAALIVGSAHHATTFGTTTKSRFISPTYELEGSLYDGYADRVGVGKGLAALFHRPGADSPVKIAAMAAGAIPYYSKLPSLDLLGLNDRWIARHGDPYTLYPGHLRVAPKSYVESQEVNLYLGPNVLECPPRPPHRFMIGEALRRFGERLTPPPPKPTDALARLAEYGPVLALPMPGGCTSYAAYMRPHPLIEELLSASRIAYHRPPA